jgi:hypothetical protein
MPIEIKELIVRAVIGGADMDSAKKGSRKKGGQDPKELQHVAEMLDQMKQMMLDHKER